MQLIEAFVQNRVKVTVGVLLVALFGVIALLRMPTQLTPEVQVPTITVETRWPGASPQEVEREIILEQEEQLKSVEGVTKMTSESMDSTGRVTMEFVVGTDMSEALLMTSTRLQQVPEYPEDADEPIVSTSNLSDRPIAWFILSQKTPTAEEIRAFQKSHPKVANAPRLRLTHGQRRPHLPPDQGRGEDLPGGRRAAAAAERRAQDAEVRRGLHRGPLRTRARRLQLERSGRS